MDTSKNKEDKLTSEELPSYEAQSDTEETTPIIENEVSIQDEVSYSGNISNTNIPFVRNYENFSTFSYFSENFRLFKKFITLKNFHPSDTPLSFSYFLSFYFLNCCIFNVLLLIFCKSEGWDVDINIYIIMALYMVFTYVIILITCIYVSCFNQSPYNTNYAVSLAIITHYPFVLFIAFQIEGFVPLIFHLYLFVIIMYILSYIVRSYQDRINLSFIYKFLLYITVIYVIYILNWFSIEKFMNKKYSQIEAV